VRGAPWSTIAQACLFALLWHVAIAFIPRGDMKPWVSVALAITAALFPIVVAVNWGYNEACRESRRRADQKASLMAEEMGRATERAPASSTQSGSDAIKADLDRDRHGTV
jgi:hypothetical protein